MRAVKPLVIDIYHGDRVIDAEAVKAFGIVGVIHKASEGTDISDPLYAARRKLFTDLGLKWGAYHFFHGLRPIEEADAFLARAEADADTLVALDWENSPDGASAPDAAAARAFLERVEEKLGRKAVIYSGNVAKEEIKGADDFFGSHRLWLCEYGAAWRVQASWQRPWLWQNNGDACGPGPHTIPGIQGHCDNNTIVGPMIVDQLLAEWAS
jgi:GH25 family lysozyme M1 (1,4-beta-N-acetylmuramidase)